MGKRTSYEPGTFSWIELSTTQPDAAKEFYGGLFGWEADDQEIPDGGVYSLMQIEGERVAAIVEQMQDQREAGVPPNWFSYVTVASADDAAARAAELGGTVHAPAFDVMDAGRMAVIADPAGAAFGVWEAGETIGATLVNDPGCLTMNELATNEPDQAKSFYEGLFGWRFDALDVGDDFPPYWGIYHDGAANGTNGGMRELAPEQAEAGIPPHWLPYFTTASVDDTVTKGGELGGGVLAPAFDIPPGRIAVLHDPQGAAFAIFEGDVDD